MRPSSGLFDNDRCSAACDPQYGGAGYRIGPQVPTSDDMTSFIIISTQIYLVPLLLTFDTFHVFPPKKYYSEKCSFT